jgi:TolA-binding protein
VQQWAAQRKLGALPNYLCRQVIQWATNNPQDPRVPEALHLAVNSTRHGCTDSASGRWSKAAFDLLHRKYPNSTWAKKTPYWFKE